MSSLTSWITNTRKPTIKTPLLVNIGPGKFGSLSCSYSDVSFRGAGRDNTTIGDNSAGIVAYNCDRLHVQDLTVKTVNSGAIASVYWALGGSSTWVNVRLDGGLYGWTEECSTAPQSVRPVHRWWSSTIQSSVKLAYLVQCSENWFYGTEFITAPHPDSVDNPLLGVVARAMFEFERPEIHIYGSVIRLIANVGRSFPEPSAAGTGQGILAVGAGKNAEIHVHGTGIDIIGNELPNSVAALATIGNGVIHANQSAFNLKTGPGGKIIRIKDQSVSGHGVHAPYLWEQHSTPPNITSANGADMAVVTDGAQPRLLINSNNCASGWFDPGTSTCR